ncbi:MAG: flagellar basal body-associated FliL family protein [Magnetovibrio sp.]|nr:flagellar basal body-associated FliL family protein [Magnetovibrio sp.]
MADDELDDDDAEEIEGEEDEEGGGQSGGRKRLIMVVGGILVLILGGLAAAYFTGMLQPVIDMLGGGKPPADQNAKAKDPTVNADAVFYDLQEMLVNINTGGRKPVYLKIRVSLELASNSDIVQVEAVMPRIIDNFQIYLRELRIEDLKGSAGMYRLREELLKRVSVAAAPAVVNDVLFKEMLVQ